MLRGIERENEDKCTSGHTPRHQRNTDRGELGRVSE